jgi:hypothetical protein
MFIIGASLFIVAVFSGCAETKPPTATEVEVFNAYVTFFSEKVNDPLYAASGSSEGLSMSESIRAAMVASYTKITKAYLESADKSQLPVFREWKGLSADEFAHKFDTTLSELLEKLGTSNEFKQQYEKFPTSQKAGFRKVNLQALHASIESAISV